MITYLLQIAKRCTLLFTLYSQASHELSQAGSSAAILTVPIQGVSIQAQYGFISVLEETNWSFMWRIMRFCAKLLCEVMCFGVATVDSSVEAFRFDKSSSPET